MLNIREIYLVGGCFWGTEAFMQLISGVIDVQSGYVNGNIENPSYQDVCRKRARRSGKVTRDTD